MDIRIPLGPLRLSIFCLKHREILNTPIFWYVTQCVWAKCSRRFEGTIYIRNVGKPSPNDTASHLGRYETSAIPTWEPKILHVYVIKNLGGLCLLQMNRLFLVLFFFQKFTNCFVRYCFSCCIVLLYLITDTFPQPSIKMQKAPSFLLPCIVAVYRLYLVVCKNYGLKLLYILPNNILVLFHNFS